METLTDHTAGTDLKRRILQQAEREIGLSKTPKRKSRRKRSTILPASVIPRDPVLGPRVVHDMPLESVFQHLFKKELFRLSWGAKNKRGEEWVRLKAEFDARLSRMQRETLRESWLHPQGVYGYWPAQSEGDDLIVYEPASVNVTQVQDNKPVELLRFSFPRQIKGDQLCLADYFSPVNSGVLDIAAFQVVTVGAMATERFNALQEVDDYTAGYYFHGLAVQTAEAAAEYLHQHIRRELGLPTGQGKRYSWGYPAIPNLDDHRKVFDLLPAEAELGMSLTSAFQLVPEQSTAAIIVHHPDAKYFSIGNSRVEQLMRA